MSCIAASEGYCCMLRSLKKLVERYVFGRSLKIELYETKMALRTNPFRKQWVLRHLPTFSRLVGLSVVITPKSISPAELEMYDMLFGESIMAERSKEERQREKEVKSLPPKVEFVRPEELITSMAKQLKRHLNLHSVPAMLCSGKEEEVKFNDAIEYLKVQDYRCAFLGALYQSSDLIESDSWIAFSVFNNCTPVFQDPDVMGHLESEYITQTILDACKPSAIVEIHEEQVEIALLNIYSENQERFWDLHMTARGFAQELCYILALYLSKDGREILGDFLQDIENLGETLLDTIISEAKEIDPPNSIMLQARGLMAEDGTIVSDKLTPEDIMESLNFPGNLLRCEVFQTEWN